jgi:V/A-type H+-transporting ATPase subunit D
VAALVSGHPTKSNVLKLQAELKLAEEGHDLLDQKREVLLGELMRALYEFEQVASEFHEKLSRLMRLVRHSHLRMGEEKIRQVYSFAIKPLTLDPLYRSVMGVPIPHFDHPDPHLQPRPSPEECCPAMEASFNLAFKLVPLLVRYAELHTAVWRLATEVEKTRRRVNALENLFIPEYNKTINRIQDILEENEREAFFQRKRVKSKIVPADK